MKALLRLYEGSMKAYEGSMKALLRLYEGSIKAPDYSNAANALMSLAGAPLLVHTKLYEGSIKALFRLYEGSSKAPDYGNKANAQFTCVLYWYKSTNTDASAGAAGVLLLSAPAVCTYRHAHATRAVYWCVNRLIHY